MKCKIEWIDENGKPTPDDNDAIGIAVREAYHVEPSYEPLDPADRMPAYDVEEQRFPICIEHARELREKGYKHWHIELFEGPEVA